MGICHSGYKFKNSTQIRGLGGELQPVGKTIVLVTAFDYEGYGAEEKSGCGQLSCTPDGMRFADLARQSGAEVHAFYDKSCGQCEGFPNRDDIVAKMRAIGAQLGPGDAFVFFYAGHGTQGGAGGAEEADGMNEEMCFVDPTGEYTPITDDEIAELLMEFNPETHVLFVTDCCQSATVCDLQQEEFSDRPYCHLAAVKDSQYAADLGDGGAFTSSLLESIEQLVGEGKTEFSIVEVYNTCFGQFSDRFENQDFQFERTPQMDPDAFPWPLVPPAGYTVDTQLDE